MSWTLYTVHVLYVSLIALAFLARTSWPLREVFAVLYYKCTHPKIYDFNFITDILIYVKWLGVG